MIDPRNFGDLKKIRFSRASRTDKKVHALINFFACKLHFDPSKTFEDHVNLLNEKCSKDLRFFKIVESGRKFDARVCVSH